MPTPTGSSSIDEIGLVDEEIPGSYGEDYEWILRAAAVTEIAVVTRPLVRVRWHAGGSFFSDRWLLMVDGIDYILEVYNDRIPRQLGLLIDD